MERRPDPQKDEILTEEALEALQHRLSMLSGPELRTITIRSTESVVVAAAAFRRRARFSNL
jgi:hypothetical protein